MKGTTNSIAIGAGSIPRTALANGVLYSPVVTVTEGMNIETSHGGSTFFINGSGDLVLRMSKGTSNAFPVGTELAVQHFGGVPKVYFTGSRVILSGETGVKGGGTADDIVKLEVQRPYGTLALKKLASNTANGDIWLATGNVEVIA